MERIEVESSNINSIAYDDDTSILEIEFKSGAIYEYYDVPRYEYDDLLSADSKGRYANQNIYKTYRQNRIR